MKVINNTSLDYRRIGGIYKITCNKNNKFYIGSTIQNFRARLSNHLKCLRKQKGTNKYMIKDYLLYGEDSFEFEIIEVLSPEFCSSRELYWIKKLNPTYNISINTINRSRTNEGKKFSEDHKEKIRKASSKYKHSNNKEVYIHQVKINKGGASKFKLINLNSKEEIIISSLIELKSFFNSKTIFKYYNNIYKGWKIELLKTQKKSIKITTVENKEFIFKSFSECDKWLNKWRGYTSKNFLSGNKTLDGYKIEYL